MNARSQSAPGVDQDSSLLEDRQDSVAEQREAAVGLWVRPGLREDLVGHNHVVLRVLGVAKVDGWGSAQRMMSRRLTG
jgi:hypothetical protein